MTDGIRIMKNAALVAALVVPVSGCAVVTVVDAAVTVAATTVKVGAKTVGAAVDLAIPDDDEKDEKDEKD